MEEEFWSFGAQQGIHFLKYLTLDIIQVLTYRLVNGKKK